MAGWYIVRSGASIVPPQGVATRKPHLTTSLLHRCVAVSDSRGQVGIVELCESGSKVTRLWKAHDYEAWITCFGKDERVVFSGGDDCKLRVWDLRVGTTAPLLTSKWYGIM